MPPVWLATDTGYSEGSLSELLEERDITDYIPTDTKQENSMTVKGEFVYHRKARRCAGPLSNNGLAAIGTWR